MTDKKTHDISIRLGDKQYIKRELAKIAKKTGMTLQQVVIIALELFLKAKKITISLS